MSSARQHRLLGGALLLVAAAGIAYLSWLSWLVTSQFEGRRWNVASRVYAQPLALAPGLALSADQIEQELRRLAYRRSNALTQSGSYRRNGPKLELMLRRTQSANGPLQPRYVLAKTDAASIIALQGAGGERLSGVSLDPPLIGTLFPVHGEDRIIVRPDEVPALLPAALKQIEDRDFDTHHGIDVQAILRAAWVNLRAGQVEQGGSTLTQQLVKSFSERRERTFARKAREAVMAIILDARYQKAEILNAYINEIYLGQDGNRAIHGFGLASQFYFGKPLDELQLSELALLVGIVRGPSYYNPRTQPLRAKARRDFVLANLAKFAVVSEQLAAGAARQPLGVIQRATDSGRHQSYLDYVRRTLPRDYPEADLSQPGLLIFTSLEPRVQAAAQQMVDAELLRLDRRGKSKGRRLEGALVVASPSNGSVIAIIGGQRRVPTDFNRALDANRPIGSLVKPIVYLTALETGRYHAASIVYDEPVEVRLRNGDRWRPENFDGLMLGPIPAVRALAESRNLATVQLGLDIGLEQVAERFTSLGLERKPPAVPALLLGAAGLTPMEVAQLYSTFAGGGIYRQLHAVQAVVTRDGRRLPAKTAAPVRVADPTAVYQLDRMLVEVMTHGTGRAAASQLPGGLITAGKSGTSSEFRDSWFAGFAGTRLAVSWVGYDDNAPTGLSGSQAALPIWAGVMRTMAPDSWQPPLPETLEEVSIDYPSGLAATPECAEDVISVALPRGTELETLDGCGPPSLDDLGDRLRNWWRRFTR